MPKYIDADALKDKMFNYYDCVNLNTRKGNYKGETLMNYEVADMIEDCIDNAPAADVQEVKHGDWKLIKKDRSKCSECGFQRNIETQFGWKFCPMCGADMGVYKDNEKIH